MLNDGFLKAEYHNWFIGKLSDVVGVVVFAFFLTAWQPRYKKAMFWATAIAFAWWKTPYSQPLIDGWNGWEIIPLQRTVDYTDILCVLVLWPAYYYRPKTNWRPLLQKMVAYPMVVLTLFAIVATSAPDQYAGNVVSVQQFVRLKMTKAVFLEQLEQRHINYSLHSTIEVNGKTLPKYVLKDVVIGTDTIYSISIGIKDKGQRIAVYIDRIMIINENAPTNYFAKIPVMYYKEYRQWTKKYRKMARAYVEEVGSD